MTFLHTVCTTNLALTFIERSGKERKMTLLLLPNELLLRIFSLLRTTDLKRIAAVNKRINDLSQYLIFQYPSFRDPLSVKLIFHLPIQILRTSQLRGPLLSVPPSTRVVILDKRFPTLTPKMIRENREIKFIISINYLRAPNEYHFSNFLIPNVTLFTSNNCAIRDGVIAKYKDFSFNHLALSHLETYESYGQCRGIVGILSKAKIERLIVDCGHQGMETEQLLKLPNITYISSQAFPQHSIFPLYLCRKLPFIECIHLQRNTRLQFSDFTKLEYSHIFFYKNRHSVLEAVNHAKVLLYDPSNDVTRVRRDFTICVKPASDKWKSSLEDQTVHRARR